MAVIIFLATIAVVSTGWWGLMLIPDTLEWLTRAPTAPRHPPELDSDPVGG